MAKCNELQVGYCQFKAEQTVDLCQGDLPERDICMYLYHANDLKLHQLHTKSVSVCLSHGLSDGLSVYLADCLPFSV